MAPDASFAKFLGKRLILSHIARSAPGLSGDQKRGDFWRIRTVTIRVHMSPTLLSKCQVQRAPHLGVHYVGWAASAGAAAGSIYHDVTESRHVLVHYFARHGRVSKC